MRRCLPGRLVGLAAMWAVIANRFWSGFLSPHPPEWTLGNPWHAAWNDKQIMDGAKHRTGFPDKRHYALCNATAEGICRRRSGSGPCPRAIRRP